MAEDCGHTPTLDASFGCTVYHALDIPDFWIPVFGHSLLA